MSSEHLDESARLTEAERERLADVAVTGEAYYNGDHRALYDAVEALLADRLAAIEAVLAPASTLVLGDDAPEARYWKQGADAVVRAVRARITPPAETGGDPT